MPTTQLSSRERVNRAMQRQEQDRLPRYETFWRDTIERWQGEGLNGDMQTVLDQLEADFAGLGGWCSPFPEHREIVAEDEQTVTYINSWLETVREWKGRSGTPEHIGWGCTDRDVWEKTFKPAMEQLPPAVGSERTAERAKAGRQQDRWCYLATLESFEALRHLLGDVNCMMAILDDPEWIREISRTWTDLMLRRLDAQLELAGGSVDGVWCYGDMAFNHATMCSPDAYRDLIWPDHKRMADWAHQHDAKFIYHTDGNINGVMDLYIEAGFDCIQPLEAKAGMDVCELVPQYGDQITFFGNIDVMIMATNDLEKIEAEIIHKFEAGKRHRGYIYHSDHSVPPSVSWQTYQQIIELVKKHGEY